MKNKKIILDTNLWISFLISNKLNQLDELIRENKITFLLSEELILEFTDVIGRPKFKKYFSKKDIEKVFDFFDYYGELITIKSNVDLCRDTKDNFLLNLSIDGNADFLITGDQDLLVLETVKSTKIVTFQAFWQIIENE